MKLVSYITETIYKERYRQKTKLNTDTIVSKYTKDFGPNPSEVEN